MFDKQAVLDNLHDGLYTVTRMRKIIYWNRAAERITGYRADEVVGLHCYAGPLKHVDHDGNDLCADGCPLDWAMAHRREQQAGIFLHHKDGHRVPVRVGISPLLDPAGEVIGAVELFADNTEGMLALERMAELEEAALLDPLTRLANRRYLESQASRYLAEMPRQPRHIGVLVIEIDRFEILAESLDIAARQQLLQVVAETIRGNCRPLDLFGHVHDGCFIGLIHDVTSSQLFMVARKLAVLIKKSHFATGDDIVAVAASVGMTMLQPDDTFQTAVARCEKQIHLADATEQAAE